MKHLSRSEAEGFYAVHRERPFFNPLVEFMISGPVMIQALEGENAILKNRDLMGATDPKKAAPGTIRADFAQFDRRERGARFRRAGNGEGGNCVLFLQKPRFLAGAELESDGDHTSKRSTCSTYDRQGLRDLFAQLGEKPYRAEQVMKWIYHRLSPISRR